jgi:Domain of unknown function (DUF4834)
MLIKLPSLFNSVFAAAVLILSFMNVFVLAILFYMLYRFIGGFLIPLFRASRQMRQQFHDTKSQANGQPDNPPNPGSGSAGTSSKADNPKSGSSKVGEYIDFEEVK